jgi:two-component sensor histidine kinase
MASDSSEVARLQRQLKSIAEFGSFALREHDLNKILTEAAKVCAEALDAPFSKICRYRPDENDFFVEAGYGWRDGVIGHVVSPAHSNSSQVRAFMTGAPCICDDLRTETGYVLPSFYADHGIVSTVDVVIKGEDRPYGVLQIDSDRQRRHNQHDIQFLTTFANILGDAVAASTRVAMLEAAVTGMQSLVKEKNLLLDHTQVLADELQHRVRNNLQLVYGMLNKQMDETTDKTSRRGLKAIARRVTTLAQVYDHLLGTELTRTPDFAGYVKALCVSIADIQATSQSGITLACESEHLFLDLDIVTALGIVLTELVSNSYEHAFPRGAGAIRVSVGYAAGTRAWGTMIVRDNGVGFMPKLEAAGHGLGLARRLVEQIDGSISAEVDRGTVWTVKFPVAAPPVRLSTGGFSRPDTAVTRLYR